MIDRRALLSSTAPLPSLEYPTAVHACDLQSGRQYEITRSWETPHTITFEDLNETLERADKQHAERRYLTPAEQREIWENRFRPIQTEAETRKAELDAILDQQLTSGSFAEYMHWQVQIEYHLLMWGDGTDRVGGLFEERRWKAVGLVTEFMLGPTPPLTTRRK